MLKKLLHIFTYHNAVPIGFMIIFLGFGVTFAASPDARDSIISKNIEMRSVDNSFLIAKDLDSFSPQLGIISIEEDGDFYYVSYFYNTIAIKDYVWKEGAVEKKLAVSKSALGGRDLGEYLAEELGETLDASLKYLKEAQSIEKRNGVSQKVIATTYSGLVGKFFSPTEEVFEGYEPVVKKDSSITLTPAELERREQAAAELAVNTEVEARVAEEVATRTISRDEITRLVEDRVNELLSQNTAQNTPAQTAVSAVVVTSVESPSQSNTSSVDTAPPTLTIVGNNPSIIHVGDSYSDMGVTVADDVDENLGYQKYLDGALVSQISLDTSTTTTYIIEYKATDNAGNVGTAARTVIIENAIIDEPPVDTEPPTITLIGESPITIFVGDTYTDAGATAFDSFEGNLTSNIIVNNQVNTTATSTYTVTYDVADNAGNQAAQVTRTVNVINAIE